MTARPFAEGALAYWTKGWTGLFPVGSNAQPLGKAPVPTGVTGYDGKDAGFERIAAAVQSQKYGRRNLGLRMPRHIICLDVDQYEGHDGMATLAKMEAELGPLPATYRNTARGIENLSGHRYYRLPVGMTANTGAETAIGKTYGPNIEILHWGRRYAVAWPSVNARTGSRYHWYDPDGRRMDEPPAIVSIPLLPESWLPLMAAPIDSEQAKGGGLRKGAPAAPRETVPAEDADGLFTGARTLIRRSVAEMHTMDKIVAVLGMKPGAINTTIGSAGIWLGRMADAGLITIDQAREVLLAAIARNGHHSDSWNAAHGYRWTARTRVDDALSQGLNHDTPYTLIDDHRPIRMAAQLMRRIAR